MLQRSTFIFIILILFNFRLFARDSKIDSLKVELEKQNVRKKELSLSSTLFDTTTVNILFELSKCYLHMDRDSSQRYALDALDLAKRIDYKKGIAASYNSLGLLYYFNAEYGKSITNLKLSLEVYKLINNKKGMALNLMNIGNSFFVQGNYAEALDYYYQSLRLNETLNDEKAICKSLNNIGNVFSAQDDHLEALKVYHRSLSIARRIGDFQTAAMLYGNCGIIHLHLNQSDQALVMLDSSKLIHERLGNQEGLANVFYSIGDAFSVKNVKEKAFENYSKSLSIAEKLNDLRLIAANKNNLAALLIEQKKLSVARTYLDSALAIGVNINSLPIISDSYRIFVQLDSIQGDFRQAFEHQRLFSAYRDSILNSESSAKTERLKLQYDFEKQRSADSLMMAREKEVNALRLHTQRAYTNFSIAAVILAIIALFFVYRNYRNQRIANERLRATQDQLIRAEKMAAFGTIASRMAHEIQNPLNFVLNFSVFAEELASDIRTPDQDVLNTLKENLVRIRHHGSRADKIIKELQQHANTGTAHEFFEK